MASKLVTAFISSLHDSIHRRGFPDDISTYGMVSAMFFTACSIGAFIGPSLGGFLLETIGYRKGLLVIFMTDIAMVSIGTQFPQFSNVFHFKGFIAFALSDVPTNKQHRK